MICTANDLQAWKEFPKGLRVLLLDEDSDSAAEIKSKLEQMDYIVSTFCDVNGALLTVSNKLEKFHVAIVEVNTANTNAVLKFLEAAKELPTIMTSNLHCLNTMMKCIALGAVEFLQKPLSDDKLRNLWQHVVQKAFSAKENVNSVSPNLVEEPLTTEMKNHALMEIESASVGSEQYPAPSTPQLKRGGCKLFVDGDCQDQPNCSSEKDCADNDEECKSVETTCSNPVATVSCPGAMSERSGEAVIKQKDNSADSQKNDSNMSVHLPEMETVSSFVQDAENSTKASSERKTSRRKLKVDWTPELHKKFVRAVQQLGIDQAIPSRILELMKVEGLTRHNVASHLQKYRMHRRHILPKDDDGTWQQHTRDTTKRVNYYQQQRPIMAFPHYFSPHYAFPTSHQVYPVVWGHPGSLPTDLHAWSCTPGYPAWQPTETWHHWNPYSGTQADAWGCPVMPLRPLPSSTFPQNSHGFQNVDAMDDGCGTPLSCLDLHPAEDVIDNVVREVMSKPKLPLPLGLKSPSTEAVLAELSKQGISSVPCCLNATNSHLRGTP